MKIAVDHDVEAVMRDGCVLRADVFRPDDDEPHPVLLVRTPYGKVGELIAPLFPTAKMCVEAGYAVVVQDARGTGTSDGDGFFPYRDEGPDGYDTVQWAAGLPYADGQVGMFGVSYLAGAAWKAAVEAPPALRAIAVLQGPNDFHDTWWRGGALRLADTLGWALASRLWELGRRGGDPAELGRVAGAMEELADRWAHHLPVRSFPPVRPDESSSSAFLPVVLDHPVPDEWTDAILVNRRHHDVRVPALIIAGWHDSLLRSDLEHYRAVRDQGATADARDETRLVVGPWGHGAVGPTFGDVDFGAAGATAAGHPLPRLQLRWFDRWMRDQRPRAFQSPRVWVFVQGANEWRPLDDWPVPEAETVRWHLAGDGTLSTDGPVEGSRPDVFAFDPHDPCPTRGGTSITTTARVPMGPIDQGPLLERRDVLVYTSAPLAEAATILGPVRAVLHAATSGRDADWVVRLCDVHPDGRMISITDGVQRARYRAGYDAPALVEPDAFERYEVELDPTGIELAAGHRLRVLVTSSDFPRYDRNPGTGEAGTDATELVPVVQQIAHDPARPSYLELPTLRSPSSTRSSD